MATILAPYLSPRFVFSGTKQTGICLKGQTKTIDFYIDPAVYPYGVACNGLTLIKTNQVPGDSVIIQAVDKDNWLGEGPNFMMGQYCDWYVDPNASDYACIEYGDTIPPLFYLRFTYSSVGTVNDVGLFLNWYIHRKTGPS